MEREKIEFQVFYDMPQLLQRVIPCMLQWPVNSPDSLFGQTGQIREMEILTEKEALGKLAVRALFYKAGEGALGVYIPKTEMEERLKYSFSTGFIRISNPCWVPELMKTSLHLDRSAVVLPGNYPIIELKSHYGIVFGMAAMSWG